MSFRAKEEAAAVKTGRTEPEENRNTPAPTAGTEEYLQYTVQKGDTLWSVAEKFRVPLEQLLRRNGDAVTGNTPVPGETIAIPLPRQEGVTGAVNGGMIYYVKKGDTLSRIAGRFGFTAEALRRVNPFLRYGEALNPGMQLYLPGHHYVREGETMFRIGERYGVALTDLFNANPEITRSDNLPRGTQLVIPRRENGDLAQYRVEPGDTLYKIAQKYNLPVDALIHANPQIGNANLLCPGEALAIPGPHLARKGQTYAAIAAIYGFTEGELRQQPGNEATGEPPLHRRVFLPAAASGSCRSQREMGYDYRARSGDTMAEIATLFCLGEDDLRRENPGYEKEREPVCGEVIHIPIGLIAAVTYRWQEGDTLWSVAEQYGISREVLASVTAAEELRPGTLVPIPLRGQPAAFLPTPPPESRADAASPCFYPEIYIAREGETVEDVARRFGLAAADLSAVNRGLESEIAPLTAGQELVVAGDSRCCRCPWFLRETANRFR